MRSRSYDPVALTRHRFHASACGSYWDERKRSTDLTDHGLDFADAERSFVFEEAEIRPSYPGPDGCPRFVAIGPLNDRLVTVVFSPLGTEALSLISLRPASRKERRLYEES